MANQRAGWKKTGQLALMATVVSVAVSVVVTGVAQAKPAAGAVVDSVRTAGGVYKSKLSDGSIVFSDRPLEKSTGITVAQYGSGNDAAEIARKERDYWRQRSDAFAERQLARDRELEATRRASIVAEKRNEAAQVVVVSGSGVGILQSHAGKPVDTPALRTVYETSPGAVNGRFSTQLPTNGSASKFR
jgi:hypothetical protein